ncbi:hypothetical protein Leryth_013503 [Lithospermum erythrorhizon]|nr:hypothetical protein Leryth_013503 [Lithospermum erythrorhizon]
MWYGRNEARSSEAEELKIPCTRQDLKNTGVSRLHCLQMAQENHLLDLMAINDKITTTQLQTVEEESPVNNIVLPPAGATIDPTLPPQQTENNYDYLGDLINLAKTNGWWLIRTISGGGGHFVFGGGDNDFGGGDNLFGGGDNFLGGGEHLGGGGDAFIAGGGDLLGGGDKFLGGGEHLGALGGGDNILGGGDLLGGGDKFLGGGEHLGGVGGGDDIFGGGGALFGGGDKFLGGGEHLGGGGNLFGGGDKFLGGGEHLGGGGEHLVSERCSGGICDGGVEVCS